jgi:hypothetical protein
MKELNYKFFVFSFLLFLFISSCGSGLDIASSTEEELTPDQNFRMSVMANNIYESQCINFEESKWNMSDKITMRFMYFAEASVYEIIMTKYSDLNCPENNEELVAYRQTMIIHINVTPETVIANIVIPGMEREVDAAVGYGTFETFTINFTNTVEGLSYIETYKTAHPDAYRDLVPDMEYSLFSKPSPWESEDDYPDYKGTMRNPLYFEGDSFFTPTGLNNVDDPVDLVIMFTKVY